MRGQPGFWDLDDRYERLSAVGDPLEKLNSIIPWPVFEKPLAKALKRSDGSKGGRPAFPPVLMFKILVLQALYNLSDDQAEFVIQDRLSFMRFLGLSLSGKVPDAKTVWLFRENLVRAGAIDNLFARFDKHLSRSGYLAKGGQIIDATIIQAPRQHNSQDEKAAIKAGKIPDEWKDKPAKLAQKDRDARWTVKYSKARQPTETPTSAATKQHDIAIPMFGYKNHAGIDRAHGFIRGWTVTSASAHDGAQLRNVVAKDNTASTVWADSAYRSKTNEEWPEVGHPSKEAEGQAHAGSDVAGQRPPLESALRRRACLRQAEGQDEALHPHDWDRQGKGEDRHGQYRLQHAPLRVPRGPACHRMRPTAPKGAVAPRYPA